MYVLAGYNINPASSWYFSFLFVAEDYFLLVTVSTKLADDYSFLDDSGSVLMIV